MQGIVLNQQLNVVAPSTSNQFLHHVSLLSSKSDSQRRESLAYLTTYISASQDGSSLPLTTSNLLDKLCPLILDGAGSVRNQLLKLIQVLPSDQLGDHIAKTLPYVRAGMTHLSRDIRMSALELLSWLITSVGRQLVSCAGGFYQTLDCFTTILGWRMFDTKKWSSSKASFGGDIKTTARVISVLSDFLHVALVDKQQSLLVNIKATEYPLWHLEHHAIPNKSNAFAYLNLFGQPREEENQILEDREDRLRLFNTRFRSIVDLGIDAARKEGGELGRAGGHLVKTLDMIQQTSDT